MREPLEPDRGIEAVDFVRRGRAVGDHPGEPDVVIARLGVNRGDDPVHREDAVEIVGRHDDRALGVLQRRGKSAAHHIAQHVEDHHIGIFEQVVLLEQLDRLANHIAAAAGAGRRAAGLDAHHPVEAFEHVVLGPQFLGVELDRFEHVDHGRHQLLGQGEGRIVLRIAADLEHPVAQHRERRRKVRRGGRFADPAFAIDREHLGGTDAVGRIEPDLDRTFAVSLADGGIEKGHVLCSFKPPLPRHPRDDPRVRRWRHGALRALLRRVTSICVPPPRAGDWRRGPRRAG